MIEEPEPKPILKKGGDSENREDEHRFDAPRPYDASAKKDAHFHESEVTHSKVESGSNHTLLIFGIAGAALLITIIIGVILVRGRSNNYDSVPTVDACSPEEKHVSAMQVNGYENPTYSFFSEKS